MKLSGQRLAWLRRGALAAILVGAVLFPGRAPSVASRPCRGGECPADGAMRWSRQLTGAWIAENGPEGTTFGPSQAYAAVGGDVAAVGFGLSVDAYDEGSGFPRWTAALSGLPAGSAIVSVRAWRGVITVGTAVASAARAAAPAGGGVAGRSGVRAPRLEVVLNAVTGKQIRIYPAATYGGAVSASLSRTVIIGPNSVTAYDNATGLPIWRDAIGRSQQAWRLDGSSLFVTISAQGVIGTAPVTAVRQIYLQTGDERLIRPTRGPFVGTFTGAIDGVLLFSSADGLSGYAVDSGRSWRRPGAVFVGADPVQLVLYADIGSSLVGIDPLTGRNVPGSEVPGPPGTYSVRNGIALGLDTGANGAAWGYSIARRRVVWTTRSLPWPHYFVDLSGVGGSSDPVNGVVLLATCARTGPPVRVPATISGGFTCVRPMLVAIER